MFAIESELNNREQFIDTTEYRSDQLNITIQLVHHAISTFQKSQFDIVGKNDPSMATRKSKLYHDIILKRAQSELQSQQYTEFFQPVPRIDDFNIPQGLAGNSAYVIKPAGAIKMIELAQEHGMWPNDALMCYQLIESLGVTRNFYTRVQGLRSTTTL